MGRDVLVYSVDMNVAPHPRRWLVLAVLASTLLVIAMDATILNVALPALSADLRPDATELLWIVDAYGLVLAGLLVAMGGLGDRIGRRRLLSIGLVLFALASAGAALAGSPVQLIAARAALGIGGAMIMPSTLSVLRNVFADERERAIAIGVWSAAASGGFALGPIVGGAVLEVASWGWVFAINIPIVVASLALVRRYVPESRNPDPGPWDSVAVALSVAGMVAFVWSVKQFGEHGLELTAVLGAAVGLTALALFVRSQLRSEKPILDVSLFADRRFAGATVAVLFVFFGFGGMLLLLTQYLQLVQGLGPLAAGVRLLPLALAVGAVSPATHLLVARVGANLVVGGGFVLVAAGLALIGALQPDSSYALIALGLALVGAGGGLAATAASAAIMASAPAERSGGAAAVQETAFELGGALGVAILGSIMAGAYRADLGGSAPEAAREGLAGAAALGDPGLFLVAQAAFIDGLGTTMAVAATATLLGAALAAILLPSRETSALRRRSIST